MSKWLLILVIIPLLLMGCTNDSSKKDNSTEKIEQEETTKNDNSTEKIEQDETPKNDNDSKQTVEVKDEKKDSKESTAKELTFLDYRPKVGTTKLFYDQGTLIFTEKIIAENNQYVQRVLELGNAVTVQVLKWTEEEITVVYESFESADPTKNILNTFIPSEKIEPIMSTKSNKDLELIDSQASVEVLQGKYGHVYVVKKSTHEVAEGESYLTYYLAPGVGIIKELYEVTGEQGYIAGSELQEIK